MYILTFFIVSFIWVCTNVSRKTKYCITLSHILPGYSIDLCHYFSFVCEHISTVRTDIAHAMSCHAVTVSHTQALAIAEVITTYCFLNSICNQIYLTLWRLSQLWAVPYIKITVTTRVHTRGRTHDVCSIRMCVIFGHKQKVIPVCTQGENWTWMQSWLQSQVVIILQV